MEFEDFESNNKIYNNKYKKLEFIGQGAYGKINLVVDTETSEHFAMKKLYNQSSKKRSYYDVNPT